MAELQDSLPPGWECKIDEKTGRPYYINHFTRVSTWEDPRRRHSRHIHGTPKHFSNVQVEHIPLQDMRSVIRMSPLAVRSSRLQDSSLIQQTETDEAVAKISALFPTVSETHIRLLLKNCRYMKSVFPEADETIILEILQNNDSNIQKTSDALKEMGFTKKDTVKIAKEKMEAKIEGKKEIEQKKNKKSPLPQPKTVEEKASLKAKLQGQYKDVAEYLISIALESVNFDENRANQILKIMIQEDSEASHKKKEESEISEPDTGISLIVPNLSDNTLPVSQSRQSIKSILKEKNDKEVSSFRRLIEKTNICKSTNLMTTKGHNPELAKGPNEHLLLVDYVDWQGPDQTIRRGPQGLAKGPNKGLLSSRTYTPRGPNSELRKGPKFGLAKGSIYSQLKAVIIGESRGK